MPRVTAAAVCVSVAISMGMGLGAASAWAGQVASARFETPAVILAPALPPPEWNDVYVGVNAGWGLRGALDAPTIGTPIADTMPAHFGTPFGYTALSLAGRAPLDQNGFVGGLQIGFNRLWSPNIVLGVEADFDGSLISGAGSFVGLARAIDNVGDPHVQAELVETRAGLSWLATLRGRAGYLASPSLLLYGTAGLAYGGAHVHTIAAGGNWDPQTPVVPDDLVSPSWGAASRILVGWTAGAGVEWVFAPQWSFKAEALYYDLGKATVTSTPSILLNLTPHSAAINVARTRVSFDGVIARFGVNRHFGWVAPSPVIAAKY